MSKGKAREGFDIDLEYGEEREDLLATLLQESGENVYIEDDHEVLIECKSEEKAKQTGNLYVEYEQKKGDEWVPSGISVTEADIWAEETRHGTWVLKPVEEMKKLVKKAIKSDECREVRGGDYNNTKGVLIPEEWVVKNPEDVS